MAGEVSVDDDFARFGPKSYAINKINSVEVRERRPHGKSGAFFCAIIGAVFLITIFQAIDSGNAPAFGSFLLAITFLIGAYWQWNRSKTREYLLFLMTSSSETQAFVTRDEGEVMSLREQIEAAMIQHSRRGGNY